MKLETNETPTAPRAVTDHRAPPRHPPAVAATRRSVRAYGPIETSLISLRVRADFLRTRKNENLCIVAARARPYGKKSCDGREWGFGRAHARTRRANFRRPRARRTIRYWNAAPPTRRRPLWPGRYCKRSRCTAVVARWPHRIRPRWPAAAAQSSPSGLWAAARHRPRRPGTSGGPRRSAPTRPTRTRPVSTRAIRRRRTTALLYTLHTSRAPRSVRL